MKPIDTILFSMGRFHNDACTGTGTKNGTCYTAEECGEKGGNNEGSCAQGFGVCCVCKLHFIYGGSD